jgi:methylenetetrahydrofolate--tRNA-(uracil-5-)-methyltransferase
MDQKQYDAFVRALLEAETAPVHGFEENMVFEGCMPVESMARRGPMVLAFGPLKPVGLKDPRTGREPYAVVQLRQDNREGTLFNLVGFQTRLKFGEQKRVFGMIPGLKNAVFARYGVMHRNTFLNSPGLLDETYQVINQPGLYFAGQMTGVEGYGKRRQRSGGRPIPGLKADG